MLGHIRARGWIVAAIFPLICAAPARAALPCDADLNEDGIVGVTDLLALLADWGMDPGGPPDLDDDGDVGVSDLLLLLAWWGPAVIDYGSPGENAEAQQIGLEMLGASGPLFVPQDVYDRIDRDLNLIRHVESGLATETHAPAWIPNQLIVKLADGAPEDEYVCLNEYYQVIDVDNLFGTWYVLTFAGKLNVVALAAIYAVAPEVEFAEPNGLIGGENFWVPTPLAAGVWRWDIDDGFMDCFDGCDCHRFYVLETDEGGNATLISYQELGPSYCNF